MVAHYPEDGAEGSLRHAIDINWQDGIIGDGVQTGAFIEDVLEAARQRLLFFNGTKFRCRENSVAITKIEEALHWLISHVAGAAESTDAFKARSELILKVFGCGELTSLPFLARQHVRRLGDIPSLPSGAHYFHLLKCALYLLGG